METYDFFMCFWLRLLGLSLSDSLFAWNEREGQGTMSQMGWRRLLATGLVVIMHSRSTGKLQKQHYAVWTEHIGDAHLGCSPPTHTTSVLSLCRQQL